MKRTFNIYRYDPDSGEKRAALAELKRFCPLVKWLGSYPVVT